MNLNTRNTRICLILLACLAGSIPEGTVGAASGLQSAQTTDKKNVIWQLGEKDGSGAEFALYPDGKDRFVSSGFSDESCYFLAGDVKSEAFPYILPGPNAHWAGGTYWSGYAMFRLPVYMKLAGIDPGQTYSFEVHLAEVPRVEAAMFLRLFVNGKAVDCPLAPGGKELLFPVCGKDLQEGVNCFALQLYNGESVSFDALVFEGEGDLRLEPIGSAPLVSLALDGNPLRVDVRTRRDVRLKIEVDGIVSDRKVEQGRSVLEIPLPATDVSLSRNVRVWEGKRLLAEKVLEQHPSQELTPADYVNQFAGSSGSRWMIGPGPWMPFGMVKIMPDNEDFHWKAGYEYNIESIMGFSHIHEWTMAGLLMMPTTGKLQLQPGTERMPDLGYRSRIDKQTEVARIGYYSVDLTDYRVKAELTATTRASLQRYTFADPEEARVLVDFFFPAEYAWTVKDLHIRKLSDTEIEGWTLNDCHSTGYDGTQEYKLHFVMQFDRPFTSMNGWIDDCVFPEIGELKPGINPHGNPWTIRHEKNGVGDAGIFMNFALSAGESVMVRTGISLVSTDNARQNLTEEMAAPFGWDFDRVVANQREVWNDLFDRVKITSGDFLEKEKFYTNLYRAISARTIWNDVNGQWMDMEEQVRQMDDPSKAIYGSDGYWGVHWTLDPFYNLLYPRYMSNWVYTFEQMYKAGGWLPHGNPGMEYFRVMVGCPAIPMIVSAYQHGIRDFDAETLYKAILHQQTADPTRHAGGGGVGNESYPDYIKYGYVPVHRNADNKPEIRSYLSNTLEYSYQDYCAAMYFKALGKPEYDSFLKRSEGWKHMFDTETGYTRPCYTDGSWLDPFDPYHAPGFCEGSAWQYTWYVPHDVPGLIGKMGEKRFISRLEKGFEESAKVNFNALGDRMELYPVNHGNEANMQAGYLFNYTSEPWRTQRWIRDIQERYYGMGSRNAYPGDEDQGQMSSWYVMSAIGLFQMDGGCGEDPVWTIGSPRFEQVEIQLDPHYYGGKTLTIKARNASRKNCYIRSMRFNGKKLSRPFIPWSELKEGGVLELDMYGK